MTDKQKQKVREKLESKKFNCPTCPLPHNLSSREIDYLIEKLEEQERELVGRIEDLKIEQPTRDHNSYGEGYDTGYNDALNEVVNSLKQDENRR